MLEFVKMLGYEFVQRALLMTAGFVGGRGYNNV